VRVLVTGAGGFLGGHIARRLAEAGFEVIAATRASPIEPPQSDAAARRFHTVTVDLARGALLPRADAIVHAAATSAWPAISVDQMLTDNVLATQTLVRQALATKTSAFVFFSSISAFGSIRVPVLTEAEPPINVDAYGMTKLIGEKLLEESAGALPSLSIRLPAVVGRGSKRNWPSECLRKLGPDMVLVGAAGRTTVAEAIGVLVEGTGSRAPVTAQPRERPAFLIDSGKAQRLLGFAPLDVLAALRQFVAENA